MDDGKPGLDASEEPFLVGLKPLRKGWAQMATAESDAGVSTKAMLGTVAPSKCGWFYSHAGPFIIFLLIVCTAYFPWLPPVQDTPAHDEWFPAAQKLDHTLHPEEHIHRSPSILHHEWIVTEASRRPDGVLKNVYLINDQFPGPVLEARSGDTLVINVINNLAQGDGISIHWHGLHMRGQNQYDGAVGFTQNPILPGTNFTYQITISDGQWGTFWYHAHDQVQRADGLFGGLVVHRPAQDGGQSAGHKQQHEDLEDRLLLVGDWYHRPAEDVLSRYMRAGSFGNEPVPDSILINGYGAYNCAMAVPARPVDCEPTGPSMVPRLSLQSGKRYRLRVVNHGSLSGVTIGTNAASMQVVEVDGGNEIASHDPASSVGVIYPGQRCDLLLSPLSTTTDGNPPFLSISLDRENFRYPNPALVEVQKFPVVMHGTPISSSSGIGGSVSILDHFDLNAATGQASMHAPFSPTADITIVLYAAEQKLSHLHNVPHGFLNQTSWKPQQKPPLPLTELAREHWDEHQFLPRIDSKNTPWVELVINNLDDGSHPFHLHGYDVYVLGSYTADRGWGSYNAFDESVPAPGGKFNLLDPIKRDTFWVPRRGYTVVRFQADNQGIWMFHCHLLWHQASGMAMGFEIY